MVLRAVVKIFFVRALAAVPHCFARSALPLDRRSEWSLCLLLLVAGCAAPPAHRPTKQQQPASHDDHNKWGGGGGLALAGWAAGFYRGARKRPQIGTKLTKNKSLSNRGGRSQQPVLVIVTRYSNYNL